MKPGVSAFQQQENAPLSPCGQTMYDAGTGGSLSLMVATFGGQKKYPLDALHPKWYPLHKGTHYNSLQKREIRLGGKRLGTKECEFSADQAIIPRGTTRAQSLGSSG